MPTVSGRISSSTTTVTTTSALIHPTKDLVAARISRIHGRGYQFPDGSWTPVPSIFCDTCGSFLCYDSWQWSQNIHLWCLRCSRPITLGVVPSGFVVMSVDCPEITGPGPVPFTEEGFARLVEREEDGKRFYTLS